MKTSRGKVDFKIRRKAETNEWLVVRYINGVRDESGTYYTTDRQDAIETKAMMECNEEYRNAGATCCGCDGIYPFTDLHAAENGKLFCPACTNVCATCGKRYMGRKYADQRGHECASCYFDRAH